MQRLLIFFIIIVALLGILLYMQNKARPPETPVAETEGTEEIPAVTIIAEGLEIPWDIAFLPEGGMLVTERIGRVTEIAKDGTKREIPVEGVKRTGEGGLLGIVLHPEFSQNRYLYLYMTAPGTNGQTENRVVRYTYENGALTERGVILDKIPGAIYHDGGRMEFGPDGMLYITTGDATDEDIAQDKNSLGGKILRLQDDGTIPVDNPFASGSAQAAVWSYGHRNPQGLAWDNSGRLWETEHGRSGIQSGLDEINLIEKGANYGWPTIEGDETQNGMKSPIRHSTASITWAPASLVYLNGSLFFGGLMGKTLYEAKLEGAKIAELKEHFKNDYGRIRTVRIGPDNMLYITTSNTDGRGSPAEGDDKIIRINPAFLQ